jgi:hypothetical protein
MNDFVIEIDGLRKTFQARTAVNGLDLKVPAAVEEVLRELVTLSASMESRFSFRPIN